MSVFILWVRRTILADITFVIIFNVTLSITKPKQKTKTKNHYSLVWTACVRAVRDINFLL
jgi:hypothetical protein